ncbi:hypothetical protein CASFOL_006098 [Castilleja foliolosa]|uniref:Uncharacterized protein n=1 Tax=Castilleja foliolosa TaxID=1961234 RepID=A0ABD3E5D9_9LAMI
MKSGKVLMVGISDIKICSCDCWYIHVRQRVGPPQGYPTSFE